MSDITYPAPDVQPRERVGLGLLSALGAVLVGIVLTVVIWRLGFIAGITSAVIAIGAVWLYSVTAGTPPRKGLVPLVVLILLGVVVSFFAVVASDLYDTYNQLTDLGLESSVGRTEFIRDNLFNGDVLSEYGKDMVMFAIFAVLGIFGTMRRLFAR